MADVIEGEATVVEPIRLIDGTLVYPDGRIEIPDAELTKEDRLEFMDRRRDNAALKTTIADLPVDIKSANILMVIISYEMIGMQHADIAFLLNTDIPHISGVVKSNDYALMKDLVINKLFETEKSDARAILAQSAPFAAAKMAKTMNEKGALGYMAAKDIVSLQRINERPQDNSMRTLEIVIIPQEELNKRSVTQLILEVPKS